MAFVLPCLAGAFLAWVGGFDFNQRGFGVALFTAAVLVIAAGAEAISWSERQ